MIRGLEPLQTEEAEGVEVIQSGGEMALKRPYRDLATTEGHLQESWGGTVDKGMQQLDKGQ